MINVTPSHTATDLSGVPWWQTSTDEITLHVSLSATFSDTLPIENSHEEWICLLQCPTATNLNLICPSPFSFQCRWHSTAQIALHDILLHHYTVLSIQYGQTLGTNGYQGTIIKMNIQNLEHDDFQVSKSPALHSCLRTKWSFTISINLSQK